MQNKTSKNNSQRFFQIILPLVGFFIIIIVCGILLIGGVSNNSLNLEKLGNISAAFLLILMIPPMLFFFVIMVALIYLTNTYSKWIQIMSPKFLSIFLRIEASNKKICKTSTEPFIFFESIYAIIKNK